MTLWKEAVEPGVRHGTWIKSAVGYKLMVLLTSVLLLVVVIWASPTSFLSYSQLSASQIQTLVSRPASHWRPLPQDLPSSPYPSSSSSSHDRIPDPRPKLPASGKDDSPPAESMQPQRQKQSVIPSPVSRNANGSTNFKSESEEQPGSSNKVAEDAPVVDPTVSNPAGQLPTEARAEMEGKYLVPLLSFQVGAGNQLIEYKSAIVTARTLNRTLCLSPFFLGPARHFGYLGDRHNGKGLHMEDRYNIPELSKMVKVASMAECMEKCEKKIDVHWRLRKASKPPAWESWFDDTPKWSMDFDRDTPRWRSTADVAAMLGPRNEARCVGLGGMFPGLRWRGVLYATSAYLQYSPTIMSAVDRIQARAFGESIAQKFISVHWRFEESNCRGYPLGLCFARCSDGAVVGNAQRSETWEQMAVEERKSGTNPGFTGVLLSKEDLSGAIHDSATGRGLKDVYLSTDGWLRGPESISILRWVVEDLRNRGMNVAGLWQVPGLPNFADGSYVVTENIGQLFGLEETEKASNQMIALVEREICGRSIVFLGSGQSSWSGAVANTREAHQCKETLSREFRDLEPNVSDAEVDNRVIERILTIQYSPDPTCRSRAKHPVMPREEEPIGWLDHLACEDRLLAGVGKCTKIIN